MVQLSLALLLVTVFYGTQIVTPGVDGIVLSGATTGFIGAYLGGRARSAAPYAAVEPILLMILAAFVVVIPASLSPPIAGAEAMGLGAGLLAVQALYAVNRYHVLPRVTGPVLSRVRTATATGVFAAVALSLLVLVIATLSGAWGELGVSQTATLIGYVAAGYFAGGILAGALVGLALPLGRWPLGRMVLGVVGGVIVYGAFAPIVNHFNVLEGKAPMEAGEQVVISVICGLLVGPPVALSTYKSL